MKIAIALLMTPAIYAIRKVALAYLENRDVGEPPRPVTLSAADSQ
jgi:hypothetical protein